MAPQRLFDSIYGSQVIALTERRAQPPKRQPARTGRRSPGTLRAQFGRAVAAGLTSVKQEATPCRLASVNYFN